MLLFAILKLMRILRLRQIIRFVGFRNIWRFVRFVRIRRIIRFIVFGLMVARFAMMLFDNGKEYYEIARERAAPYLKRAREEAELRGWDKYLDPDYYKDMLAGTCCLDDKELEECE